jgi:hypothetical protein
MAEQNKTPESEKIVAIGVQNEPTKEQTQLGQLMELKDRVIKHKTHSALVELVKLVPQSAKPLFDAWENIDIDVHEKRLTEEQGKNEYTILANQALGLIDALMVEHSSPIKLPK